MNSNRTDVTIIITSAVLAVLAIMASVLGIGQPIQLLVTLGGILLGPGGLAYRLATGAPWGECLKVGVAINIAAVMVLGLTTVAVHFWHPKVELLIPVATCVLAGLLYRRGRQDEQRGHGDQRTLSYRLGQVTDVGLVYFLGNNGIIKFLGSYPFVGGLLTTLAVISFFAREYIRLDPAGRWIHHSLIVRRIAVTLAVASAILIVSRFSNVWTINSGV